MKKLIESIATFFCFGQTMFDLVFWFAPSLRRYGFGKTFDESKLIALPAGSFYTEPANLPHFVATKGDGAVVQIGGSGPTRQIWVNPADDPSKKK